ncbi:MoaD/ThiS family protein [Paucibacter sp. APW11]|uniref:MoaD/ThiS family protein n=1 Tax=Roseateles aquae TaxID=3077235 RepID=A0ABU3P564_9BURK|nr:MoaD/ThiS family protein [Paucibacter sp. APW11]MDT8997722.1 MoaD/ThiS family protein [Paucibacter sp. APW11]
MNIVLSGVLQKHAQYQREHSLPAETVREAIETLVERFPAIGSVLLDSGGQLRKVHRLFLNGQQLSSEQVTSPVTDADRLEILTAIAGG